METVVHFLTDGLLRRCAVTHNHSQRVSIYAVQVGRMMGLEARDIDVLRVGALLHDIGKLFTPDNILQKNGKLTAEEFNIMKLHPSQGADWVEQMNWPLDFSCVIRLHHERWDGNGYPLNLRGYDIPLFARIVSVIDAYDAVREPRPYRRGLSRDEAVQVLQQARGTWYDPVLVDLFLTFLDQMEHSIANHLLEFPVATVSLSQQASMATPHAGLFDCGSQNLGELEMHD